MASCDGAYQGTETQVHTECPPDYSLVLSGALLLAICVAFGYLSHLWWHRRLLTRMWQGLRSPTSAPVAVVLFVYWLMLVGLDLLIKHEAELGHGVYATSPMVIMPIVELGKLVTSFVLWRLASCTGDVVEEVQSGQPACTAVLPSDMEGRAEQGAAAVAKLMLPVAFFYIVNNFLIFVVLAHVRLAKYAVWRNLSILFNAVIWAWVLQRHIEVHRWFAVGACLLGSCFVAIHKDGQIAVDLALLGIVLSCLLSSLASVFNERVIKSQEAASLGIDKINLLLYSEMLALMFLCFVLHGIVQGFPSPSDALGVLVDITPGAWKIIGVQVSLGLVISRVLKHADSVAKSIVGSLRDVALVVIAPLVEDARPTTITLGSACLVGLAGMIYAVQPSAVDDAGRSGRGSQVDRQKLTEDAEEGTKMIEVEGETTSASSHERE